MIQTHRLFTVIWCLLAPVVSTYSNGVHAHGYISKPESRALLCKQGGNQNCGAVQWEPQSVEGPDRYPETGPVDGQIASAGNASFSELNVQTATRWSKVAVNTGATDFTWYFTANHRARDWRYYITKNGWNQNQVLTRASFDSVPFCVVDGKNERPPTSVTHRCQVPADKSGYHVILGVWDVADTAASFYLVVDAQINGGNVPPSLWKDVGDINPTRDLVVGDSVKTRVFNSIGELPNKQTTFTVKSAAEGERNQWPKLLATAINTEHSDYAAGQLNANDQVIPATGKNEIFAVKTSDISRVEIEIKPATPPVQSIDVTGLKTQYSIVDNQVHMDFSLSAVGHFSIDNSIYNAVNNQVSNHTITVNNETKSIKMFINSATVGRHNLVVTATPTNGSIIQKTYSFDVVNSTPPPPPGNYDHVFPENITSYKAGTKVLQSKNGKIYQCKPFPYEGYCKQWTAQTTHYEPGVGSHWQMAWDLLP